ncbi:MAG: ABC transporter ATP-binding protein, partial [Oscillospiraceae bacterium]|nr:ABC transporter ATP-binding protein [Oscillospiraceae bacterium]
MIKVEHLTKRYGGHCAVDDLSFTVEEGKIYGLLGPNGAGKSTTMNIITGYISASEGTVTVDGHDVLKEACAAHACIGYLPEIPPLYMDMTPREYLNFAGELKGMKKAPRKAQVEEVMERTGIAQMGDRLIKHLSKGYKQRVGLAGALMGSPKIIILDEPTVGLDPAQVIGIRELIRDLGKSHTVILSSHILSEVQAVCDRVLIISGGKLAAQGTPEELSERLSGRTALNVTALGSAEKVRAVVESLEQGGKILELAEKDGETGLKLEVAGNADLRAPLSAALAAAGCPVTALSTETLSLEEIFLQLTE